MSKINRRDFLLNAGLISCLPAAAAAQTGARPRFRFVLPDERVFAVGETVPLRIFTKTLYPRFQVDFKVNGQTVGTASSFPYQVNWTPAQIGDYDLTAEIIAPGSGVTIGTTVKVLNLLYDAIGRRGTRLYTGEGYIPSYQTQFPEIVYGVPVNYSATLGAARTIRRIDALLAATSVYTNTLENIPFPQNYNFVTARVWNNGLSGFQSSPRSGSHSNVSIGPPDPATTVVPHLINSQGIKYYLASWTNPNIVLPASVPLALSIHFSHSSNTDFAEKISFAPSTLTGQNLLYASGQNNTPPNISSIAATSFRIWTD